MEEVVERGRGAGGEGREGEARERDEGTRKLFSTSAGFISWEKLFYKQFNYIFLIKKKLGV